ncbi:MAG: hypothetical protein A2161_17630 [Candidatus Schekmanbacteria bacterium RBG_13_48_7]|uniref:Uncharacterized protein n=1 Tax=Candidatus Schekmanbacteria bacterium RBG_13_48_7 TaxID=1817878 RepID=A0A1F7RZP1_9BACT|nr:MAG: hypothetical protein A2161_17630 [Candidatus Schekmanbacteria bacterium RBG_13_48_7]
MVNCKKVRIFSITIFACFFILIVSTVFIYGQGGLDSDLISAVKSGNLDEVESLLDKGALINARDEDGHDALYWAITTDNADIVNILLNSGASVYSRYEHLKTPLHLAAKNGNVNIVQQILKRYKFINYPDSNGVTALHEAARAGNVDVIAVLFSNSADPNVITYNSGWTPLHEAANKGYYKVVNLLINMGADIRLKSKDGETPFQLASKLKYKDITELLLSWDKMLKYLDAMDLAKKGNKMNTEEVRKLEKIVRKNPDDLESRIILLGYYFMKQFESTKNRDIRQHHVLWFIKHHPEHPIVGTPECDLHKDDNGALTEALKLWENHLATQPNNPDIFYNAGNFFTVIDINKAEMLFIRGREIDPDNPGWSDLLANNYRIRAYKSSGDEKEQWKQKSLREQEHAVKLRENTFTYLVHLSQLAINMMEANEIEKAELYAKELLSPADFYKYDRLGNCMAISAGNAILGRIILREDNIVDAKKYLLQSVTLPEYCHYNSKQGLALSRELLEKGEPDVVIWFLQLCIKYQEKRQNDLQKWIKEIRDGKIPDFH